MKTSSISLRNIENRKGDKLSPCLTPSAQLKALLYCP